MARWLLLLNARLLVIQPAELRAAFKELAISIFRRVSDTEATQQAVGVGDEAQPTAGVVAPPGSGATSPDTMVSFLPGD
jgi:hypothetical protein